MVVSLTEIIAFNGAEHAKGLDKPAAIPLQTVKVHTRAELKEEIQSLRETVRPSCDQPTENMEKRRDTEADIFLKQDFPCLKMSLVTF